ncbi:glycosyl hydrolase family 28-related protein, partial [Priestia megaterium]|uniref:glycosyl hydrolase family 28-related protein n=1 Tax=Priestia megaterium TaxID=1404 RepID=UPI0033950DE3
MYKVGNSVEQVYGGSVVKQGDRTPFGFVFRDEAGETVNIKNATVKIKIANGKALLLEKNAVLKDDYTVEFSLGQADITGSGDMRLEFTVTYSSGLQEKFPSDDWQRIKITPTLDDITQTGIAYLTFEKMKADFTQKVDDLNNRVDNIVAESGNSNIEIMESRKDIYGNTYTTLKERLDEEQTNLGDVSILDWLPANLSEAIKDLRSWVNQRAVNVRTPPYNAKADGSDETALIQRAMNETALKTKIMYAPSGTYGVSATLKVPTGLSIVGDGKRTKFKALANLNTGVSTSNNTGQFFEVHLVSDVKISDIYFDGQNFNAGALCISGSNDVTISYCYNYNTPVHGITVANQGTNLPKNINILYNSFENVLYGAQMWDAEDVLLLGNRVNKAKAGLWHAVSRRIKYIGNDVQNCEDVGIDMEGGEDCLVALNTVKACKNGELTFFKGNANNKNYGKNLVFMHNIVVSTATYIKRDGTTEDCGFGALTVHSINENLTEGLVFKNNQISVYGTRYGFYTNALGT